MREKRPKKSDRNAPVRVKPSQEECVEMVEAYANGEVTIPMLRAKYGVNSRQTLYNWMLGAVGDKAYHELVTQALVNRVAEGDQMIEDAEDVFQIQKAREIARFSRMDLERRRPALYGQKQLNVHVGEVRVTGLAGRATELLEVEDAEEVK